MTRNGDLMVLTQAPHRKRWVELVPMRSSAIIRVDKDEAEVEPDFLTYERVPETPKRYVFSSDSFEVVVHDKPSENLQKLLDAGIEEVIGCRALDALGLE